MMTSDFISHKKLELKLIVHYYDESSLKDHPCCGRTLTHKFHLSDHPYDHLLNWANYISRWPFWPGVPTVIDNDSDLRVKVKNSLYLFRTGLRVIGPIAVINWPCG